jgi:ribonuclease HI
MGKTTKIYTDGSHTEICYVIGQDKPIRQPISERGNVPEYLACIAALQEAARRGLRHVEVLSDSELMVKQLNGQYKVKQFKLLKFTQIIKMLTNLFDAVEFEWVPREQNLAGIELDRKEEEDGE